MKVNLTAEMKKFITVAEMPAVKKVMQYDKVIEATARIAKNQRVWDAFDEETRDIDVWIEFTAFSEYRSSFIIAGVYLTDLWQLTKDNADEIKSHMYIRRFEEVG